MKNCLICDRIAQIKIGQNPFFVTELTTGYAVLEDHQFYKGYTIFILKDHVEELHFLGTKSTDFLKEMTMVAESVYAVCHPQKLNYELLGNTWPHLHWHIIPRYASDSQPNSPIWLIDPGIRSAKTIDPTTEKFQNLKNRLRGKIDDLHHRPR